MQQYVATLVTRSESSPQPSTGEPLFESSCSVVSWDDIHTGRFGIPPTLRTFEWCHPRMLVKGTISLLRSDKP